MTDRLAEALLRLAERIAPPERRALIEGLRAEADLIEDRREALRWAAGGLFAALGWALRKDLLFVVVLAGVGHWLAWIYGFGMDLAMAGGASFFDAAFWSRIICVVLLSALFAARRPDRAGLVVILTPAMVWEGLVRSLLTEEFRVLSLGLEALFQWTWPAVIGAGLGVLAGRRLRRVARAAR